MRTYIDIPLERVVSAPTWRARFFEAAANASVAIVEYSLRHHDSDNAALWMGRLHFFREKARLSA
jgi:hypothetical protein